QELAELRTELRCEISAPGVHVLAQQRELAHAVAREPRHLGDHLARTAAHLATTHGRNDAVRALRVAAHGNLHPRLKHALAVHRQVTGKAALVETESPALDPESAGAQPLPETRD